MHVSYLDTANAIAKKAWGKQFPSKEEAEAEMLKDMPRLSAMANVELLRRFNAVSMAVGDSSAHPSECYRCRVHKPDEPDVFPGKNVGDFLFSCDLEEGLNTRVIVAKNESHNCMVCAADDFDTDNPPYISIASGLYATKEEAVAEAAKNEKKYLAPRLQFAEQALLAIENGDNIERFCEGFEEE